MTVEADTPCVREPCGLASRLAAGATLVFVLGVGCASGGPAFDGRVYRHDGVAFSLPGIPASWRRVEVPSARLAYRDEANHASVLFNAHCHRTEDDVPLVALTHHLVMGTTDRDICQQQTVPLDGREALHTRMVAKLDGVPMGYDLFVLKKDGCVYDLAYVGDLTRFEQGVGPFGQVVAGFHTLGTRDGR